MWAKAVSGARERAAQRQQGSVPTPGDAGRPPPVFSELWTGLVAVEGHSSLIRRVPRGSQFTPGTWGNARCSGEGDQLDPLLKLIFFFHFPAMIVRFLTKRFIGDYEPNTG